MTHKPYLDHLQPTERYALEDFIELIQQQFGNLIQAVVLFGSKARGDSTIHSDIDVLVVVDSNDWRIHKQIRYLAVDVCLKYDYEIDISPRIWSTSHFEKMKAMQASLYRNIQKDGINLLDLAELA